MRQAVNNCAGGGAVELPEVSQYPGLAIPSNTGKIKHGPPDI
jgi:hypothetical protein